ncbi:MAG: thioredoxin domain-containing protein [Spirochaetota bacterium]|uniref:thioredoxin domain-containing protein n=1 Tax=Candidatus Jordarchaeum sp. TaxID=2823881 RepID=UPI00404973C9
MLKPGIKAPDFNLQAINSSKTLSLNKLNWKWRVLIFVPANFLTETNEKIFQYEGRGDEFRKHGAFVSGITNAGENKLNLSSITNISFPILSDNTGSVALQYRAISNNGIIHPAVFIVDDQNTIRKVFEASKYPDLPNPAAVIRALIQLENTPVPDPVTEKDWQLGPSSAPITIIEYGDYQCKLCAESFAILDSILPLYEGKVRLVHRHLPLRHSHPQSQIAAEATEAAGKQGKFWEMHRLLFKSTDALEMENLIEYARRISLDVDKFIHDLKSGAYRESVDDDFKRAIKNKIKLPPALFINSILFEGPRTKETICTRIEELLSCIDDF